MIFFDSGHKIKEKKYVASHIVLLLCNFILRLGQFINCVAAEETLLYGVCICETEIICSIN